MLLETLDRTLQSTLYWHRVDVMAPTVEVLAQEAVYMFAAQAYDVLMALFYADLSEAQAQSEDERKVAVVMAAIAAALRRRLDRDVMLLKPGLAQALGVALVQSSFAKYGIKGTMASIRGQEWLLAHGAELVTQIDDYSRQQMRRLLVDSFANGESIETTANRLMAAYDDMAVYRARRIAITETSRAWSYAELQSGYDFEDAGYTMVKEWLLGPMHPRYDICDHNREEGAIPLRRPFSSGDMAPPQHPNCGCSLITYPSNAVRQPWGAQVLGQTPMMPFGFDQGEPEV